MSEYNSRLIEKDVLASVPATSAGESAVIDLFGQSGGSSKLSCQAVYDVQAPSAKTFDSGETQVETFTFDTKANTGAGDYLVVYDTTGLAWAAAANKTGSDPQPTGVIWAAIPSARKTFVDISGATTGADIAALFETALNALVDVPFTSTDTVADLACVQDMRGLCTVSTTHNANDSGAGSITVATYPGVNSEVNVTDNTVTIPSHGYTTGFKVRLTTTGTLPDPLMTATDYFVIVVSSSVIQFASSLSNALAGTAIDLVDQGSEAAVNTVTGVALAGASVTFQKSNDGTNWINVQSATSITIDGSVMINQPNVSYRYFKVVKALTSGQVDLKAYVLAIGDAI